MKRKYLLGAIIGGTIAVGIMSLSVGFTNNKARSKYSQLKMNQISKLLNKSYLGEIDNKKIEDSIYAGYVSGLEDPLTRYLNEEELKEQQVLQEGKYIGTGIQFEWGLNGRYMIVTDVVPGSPADREKILQGDKITEVDGIKVMLSNESEIYKKLTYTGDEKIVYTVLDNSEQNERKVSLRSEIIEVRSISYELIEPSIGYIAILSVKNNLSQDMSESIEKLKRQGAEKFIIDIRNTYGNNIEEVYKLCNLFIDNQTVFKVKDKQGTIKEYQTNSAQHNNKLAVIINKRTRGALEVFAAAVQYLARGKVIGETSAGLGSISEIISLGDNTGVMISTGIIYRPDGTSLKDKGVVPDIQVKNSVESVVEVLTTGRSDLKKDLQLMEAAKALR